MTVIKCRNLNHTKINVSIRNCPSCGMIVNGTIAKGRCKDEEHARQRKERNPYCYDCGIKFTDT